MAAATDAWGDDGSQPVRYDPISAAAEGWGDDGTPPVHYDPLTVAQKGGGDDESQPLYCDPMADAQEDWGDDGGQPVTEVPATEDETPAAEATEGEAPKAAPGMENEEDQVTKERGKRMMHLKKRWMH